MSTASTAEVPVRVLHLDSLVSGVNTDKRERDIGKHLTGYLMATLRLAETSVPTLTRWDILQQPNEYDCGPYMLAYAGCLVARLKNGPEDPFDDSFREHVKQVAVGSRGRLHRSLMTRTWISVPPPTGGRGWHDEDHSAGRRTLTDEELTNVMLCLKEKVLLQPS